MNHYPRHIGDWMTATAHLSELEECIYSRMVDQYYAREAPMPLDLVAVCRLVRAATAAAKRAVGTILGEFFTKQDDGWHQQRCDEEIVAYHALDEGRELRKAHEAERVHRHREERASLFAALKVAGIVPNWNTSIAKLRKLVAQNGPVTRTEALQNANSNATATAYQNREPEPLTKEVKSDVGLAPNPGPPAVQKNGFKDAARRVLECLNRNAGRVYQPVDPNIDPIVARMREGYSERELCAIAAVKARQWKGDEKMEPYIRPKTLFNATNAAQYRAELPSNKIEASDA